MVSRKVKSFGKGYSLVTGAEEVSFIQDYVGGKANEFVAFFVKEKGGEYVEVWGLDNLVPRLNDVAERVK